MQTQHHIAELKLSTRPDRMVKAQQPEPVLECAHCVESGSVATQSGVQNMGSCLLGTVYFCNHCRSEWIDRSKPKSYGPIDNELWEKVRKLASGYMSLREYEELQLSGFGIKWLTEFAIKEKLIRSDDTLVGSDYKRQNPRNA